MNSPVFASSTTVSCRIFGPAPPGPSPTRTELRPVNVTTQAIGLRTVRVLVVNPKVTGPTSFARSVVGFCQFFVSTFPLAIATAFCAEISPGAESAGLNEQQPVMTNPARDIVAGTWSTVGPAAAAGAVKASAVSRTKVRATRSGTLFA